MLKKLCIGIYLFFNLQYCVSSQEVFSHKNIGTFYGIFHLHHKKIIDLSSLNIGCVRLNIDWGQIEPQRGKFISNPPVFKRIDECLGMGIEVIPVIRTRGADWALEESSKNVSRAPLDLEENFNSQYGYSKSYYKFIEKIARRYKGKFKIVVIENEATSKKFWASSIEDYIKILITAKKAFKDVDPHVKIADSGIASFGWGILIIDELLKQGREQEAFQFYKIYFKHAYMKRKFFEPAQLKRYMNSSRIREHLKRIRYLVSKLKDIVDVLNFHYYEAPDKFLYLLNFIKNKTGCFYVMSNELGARYTFDTPQRLMKAASDLVKKLVLAKANGLVAIIWFPFNNAEHNIIGLGDKEKVITFTFRAFKLCTRLLNRPLKSYRNLSSSNIQRHLFLSDNLKVEVIWTNKPDLKIKIKLPSDVEVYNFQGEKQQYTDCITVDNFPLFLVSQSAMPL
ncbi:MAG: hypothetical protein DRN08_05660 [Thermoplasmata archaeon]|nr:MAG: hypothetical protein DRN08_05660 [Thermoplasmata archaeon]